MFEKAKGILHTLRFVWLGRFGGSIDGGEYYLLKPIRIHKTADVSLSNLTLNKLHNENLFLTDDEFNIEMKDTKWIFK